MRTDGRTDEAKLIVAVRSFSNVSKILVNGPEPSVPPAEQSEQTFTLFVPRPGCAEGVREDTIDPARLQQQ
jgi:hypothetical protein